MNLFLERVGDDMENIRMELEKLISYTMGSEVVTVEDVKVITTVQITNKIFDMVAAITAGKTKRAMDLYEDPADTQGAADADPVPDCQTV